VSTASPFVPFFLPGATGKLFALHFPASVPEPARGGILLLPPFAEELNKSRALIARQARALAAAGYEVLLLDLFGTGDSEGEFAQAEWPVWVDDLRRGVSWLRQRGLSCVHLWAVRAGALFVGDLAECLDPERSQLILWHPVHSGRHFATQLLRLRIAAEAQSSGTLSTEQLRQELRTRGELEIAGYAINAGMLAALEARTLETALDRAVKRIVWLDVVAAEGKAPPASAALLGRLRRPDRETCYQSVVGEPFWGTVEIVALPGLIKATGMLLAGTAATAGAL
jgi:exosortase A-associated hydrolase 2